MKIFCVILLFYNSQLLLGQTFIAKYELTYDKNKMVDSLLKDRIDINIKNNILKSLPNSYYYYLIHSDSKSIYYISKSDIIQENQIDILKENIVEFSPIIFKDFENNKISKKEHILDKAFILIDSLKNFEVKEIYNEEFKYGDFTSKKAKVIDNTVESEEIFLTYTEEIPIQDGPHYFFGMPGLILEVLSKNYTIKLIELKTTSKNTHIEFNEKGKLISQYEFNKIFKEKMKF